MKMIPREVILRCKCHMDMDKRVGGKAWYKMHDALYDKVWDEHIFIWYQIDGALKNNLRGPGIP